MVDAPVAEEPPPALPDAERAEVAARMRAQIAELRTPNADDAPPPPVSKPISAGHLAAIRDENPLIQAARRMQAEMADKGDA